jgi:hypothetical protein
MAQLYEWLVKALKYLGLIELAVTLLVEYLTKFLTAYASRSQTAIVLA